MELEVDKIILFTLSACPTGRSMGHVIREVKRIYDGINVETAYVDIQTELTNKYQVKKNPTTLFLDKEGNELHRIEKFQETESVINLIERLHEQEVVVRQFEENKETVENYTVYLFQNDIAVPIEIQVANKTGVQAPRIIAINTLLKARRQGYVNPFPHSSSLELVNFNNNFGDIVINIKSEEEEQVYKEKMRVALVSTLSHFGIDDVELTVTH
jgi:hypothetical protein